MMPFMFLLAAEGASVIFRFKKPGERWMIITCMGLFLLNDIAMMISAGPNQLAFVNQLGGGPNRAWHLATDSNVDWGQEVRRLGPLVDDLSSRGLQPIGTIYTPDALEFYDIDLPQLDEAMLLKVAPDGVLKRGNGNTVLIWSATKAAGFSPSPAAAQEFMQSAMIDGSFKQYGQGYFYMVLKDVDDMD
jgi:hypothetical protein